MIGLVLIVRDEEAVLDDTLFSAARICARATIVDTGSIDSTIQIAERWVEGIGGKVYERPWVDFGHNRTEALELARGTAEWLLMLDADMTVEAHEDLVEWMETDPDPTVDAWNVEMVDGDLSWRNPRLVRGDREWTYLEPVHEYLDTTGMNVRPLLGLTLRHRGNTRNPIVKYDHYLQMLKPGLEREEPRATFYSAECLKLLGCTQAAIDLYSKRSSMNSYEEEAWYAAYQAARLSRNVTGLLEAFQRRPWRSEPLQAAAEIVRTLPHNDQLFMEAP